MSEAFFVTASLALLLAAIALVMWQWAARRQARDAASKYLVQQLQERIAREEAAFASRRSSVSAGVMVDPWMKVPAGVQTQRKIRLAPISLPGWLEGAVTPRLLAFGSVAGLLACAAVWLLAGWVAAGGVLVLLTLLAAFGVWLRVQKFRKKLVSQLPAFIDAMVRLITIGNSTHAAFQLSIASTKEPLRGYMERASSSVRAGVDLDQALRQMAQSVRIEEMYLLASILGLGVRYGGRADILLERVANFMRDREQAEHELIAMSSETRLSAWILGLLPVCVGMAIVSTNASYYVQMWHDKTGQLMIFGALGLQITGALMLYRLARLA